MKHSNRLIAYITLCSLLIICTIVLGFSKPVLPEPITVPLGEINKTSALNIPSSQQLIYQERFDISTSNIPPAALCEKYIQDRHDSIENVLHYTFRCGWIDETQHIPLQIANVTVSIPDSDEVDSWKFDRATLQLLPIAENIFFYHPLSGLAVILLLLILLTLVDLLKTCLEKEKTYECT